MDKSKIKRIALIGYGCVGEGVYQLLQKEQTPFEIVKIVVKSTGKKRSAPKNLFQYTLDGIFDKKEVDVIIEAIDESTAALGICETAIKTGIPFISANKKMLAENLNLINNWRIENNTPVFFEAAVCAEIPVLKELNRWIKSKSVSSISGVFNGTSNYILSQMGSLGLSYKDALEKAQKNGFAESDPSSDVKGMDSLFKATILSTFVHGEVLEPSNGFTYGIENISAFDIEWAKSRGQKIKLKASIFNGVNGLEIFVLPTLVDSKDSSWNVEDEWNVVEIKSTSERKILIGKGAGAEPTAKAILQNLFDVISKVAPYPILHDREKSNSLETKIDVILRGPFSAQLLVEKALERSIAISEEDQILIETSLSLGQINAFKNKLQEEGVVILRNQKKELFLSSSKEQEFYLN